MRGWERYPRGRSLGCVVWDDGEARSDKVSFLGQWVVKCHLLKRLKPGMGQSVGRCINHFFLFSVF